MCVIARAKSAPRLRDARERTRQSFAFRESGAVSTSGAPNAKQRNARAIYDLITLRIDSVR